MTVLDGRVRAEGIVGFLFVVFDHPPSGCHTNIVAPQEEVDVGDGDAIEGLLASKPFFIPDLHEGQRVTVRQQDVFDYIHTKPDSTVDGNETTALIEARGEMFNAGVKE